MKNKIILDVFNKTAEIYADNTAIEEDEKITYRQLQQSVNRLANFLIYAGLKKADVVAVFLPSGIHLIESMLASFGVGAIYLPLDVTLTPKRLNTIFLNCLPTVIITNDNLYPALQDEVIKSDSSIKDLLVIGDTGDFKHLAIDDLQSGFTYIGKNTLSSESLKVKCEPDDGNYIVYTSGSTGMGKAILGCHKSLSHFIHWELKEFKIDNSCRVGQLAKTTFDASFRDVFVPLCSGGTLYIPSEEIKSNPTLLIQWINDKEINVLHCVPSVLKILTNVLVNELNNKCLKHLKYVFVAGEVLFVKDILAWRKAAGAHIELINLYGTSESTMAKTFNRIKELPANASGIVHVGKPIDNALVAIVKDNQLCPPGHIGDIYIKTPFYTKGYYRNEPQTKTIFVPNPLTGDEKDVFHKTGDLGRYLEDGNVEVLGRLDDQVKVNGIRIELSEIKQTVLEMAQIRDAEILVNDETGFNELICYYTGNVKEDALRAHLMLVLGESVVPTYLMPIKEFPLNMHGKVDRKMLPKPDKILFVGQPYEAPLNSTEKQIETIWKEVLITKKIGRNTSFFKAGGTSLRAMRVISSIYREFQVNISLAEFFKALTVKQLSLLILEKKESRFNQISVIDEQADYEVTQVQQDLWIMDRLKKTKNVYNIINASRIQGKVDIAIFKKALIATIERHESLRTVFSGVDSLPRQKILTDINIKDYFMYISLTRNNDTAEKIDKIISSELLKGFDLDNGPYLRVKLICTAVGDYIYLMTIHHIIADGWSIDILNRDILHFYSCFASGKMEDLPLLTIQYKDYSKWLNNQLTGSSLKEMELYWTDKLKGNLNAVEFPLDNLRPAEISFKGDLYRFELDKQLSKKIIDIIAKKDVTLFIYLNTIINILLYKYTGRKELLIGSPFSGRVHKSLENQSGLFVNIVLLRVLVENNESFSTFLEKNKQEIINVWPHQLYPLNYLGPLLQYELPKNRFPFVNILTQLQSNSLSQKWEGNDDLNIFPIETKHTTSKADITFNFLEEPDLISFVIEYNTDLFHLSTIEKLKDVICYLCDLFSTDESGLLSELSLPLSLSEHNEELKFKKMMQSL